MSNSKDKDINTDSVTDEQLMAYADNELSDVELIKTIKNSPELQKRLTPFVETAILMKEIKSEITEQEIADDLDWLLRQKKFTPNIAREASKTSRKNLNLLSILGQQVSQPIFMLAASMLIVFGIFINMQTTIPEWQHRYSSLGYDPDNISTETWFSSDKNISSYYFNESIINTENITTEVTNLKSDTEKPDGLNNQNELEAYFTDQNLIMDIAVFRGVLRDMTDNNQSRAQITIYENKMIEVRLLGMDMSMENCILGELSHGDENKKNHFINQKFFHYCAYNFDNPIQLIP